MTEKFINHTFRKLYLDNEIDGDIELSSTEFKNAYKFLTNYGFNFDEDVLLQIETTPDAMIVLLVEYQRALTSKHILQVI
jgi:hypothetical protein